MKLIELFHYLKEKWKSFVLLLCTTFMPFLDDHSEKLLMAFMAIITFESYKKEGKKKKGKDKT